MAVKMYVPPDHTLTVSEVWVTRHDVRHGRNDQNMPPGGDAMVVCATLNNIRNRSAIAIFQLKFATLMTTRRPASLAAALANGTAEKKTRIKEIR